MNIISSHKHSRRQKVKRERQRQLARRERRERSYNIDFVLFVFHKTSVWKKLLLLLLAEKVGEEKGLAILSLILT